MLTLIKTPFPKNDFVYQLSFQKILSERQERQRKVKLIHEGNWQISCTDALDLTFECLFSNSGCL